MMRKRGGGGGGGEGIKRNGECPHLPEILLESLRVEAEGARPGMIPEPDQDNIDGEGNWRDARGMDRRWGERCCLSRGDELGFSGLEEDGSSLPSLGHARLSEGRRRSDCARQDVRWFAEEGHGVLLLHPRGVSDFALVIGDSLRLNTNLGMCFGARVATVDATTSSHKRPAACRRGILPSNERSVLTHISC